jgi:hypothetical protein
VGAMITGWTGRKFKQGPAECDDPYLVQNENNRLIPVLKF